MGTDGTGGSGALGAASRAGIAGVGAACTGLISSAGATGWTDAVRNAAVMACVSGVYYWRARTEERHLKLDPDYQRYWEWMERNGAVPRAFAWVRGRLG